MFGVSSVSSSLDVYALTSALQLLSAGAVQYGGSSAPVTS